jgi:enoyl-CoA hydratase/carnithine racemase
MRAMELLLTAQLISADEGARLGLVHRVVPAAISKRGWRRFARSGSRITRKMLSAWQGFYMHMHMHWHC